MPIAQSERETMKHSANAAPDVGSADRPPSKQSQKSLARKLFTGFAAVLAWCLVALFVVLFLTPNVLRPLINHTVTNAAGRPFAIYGNLHIYPGFPPVVAAENIELGNPPWDGENKMIQIERAEFHIHLLPLLDGKVELPEIHLSEPQILLEKNSIGEPNWKLGSSEVAAKTKGSKNLLPDIGLLAVDHGTLIYRDPATKSDVILRISSQTDANGKPALKLEASGTYKGNKISGNGTSGGILALTNDSHAFPIDVKVSIGDTKAAVNGNITGLTSFGAVDAELDLQGNTLSALYPILGIALPQTRPYRVKGNLKRAGDNWSFQDFSGGVGNSDLGGDFHVDLANGRPAIQAKMESKELDLAELQGFVGKSPEAKGSDPESRAQQKSAKKQDASEKAAPEEGWRLDRLRSIDADFILEAKSIQGTTNPLEDLKMHFKLKDGLVSIDPLNFGIASGNIISTVGLDAGKDVPQMHADAEFQKIRLGELFPGNETLGRSAGTVGGRVKLSGKGRSTSELLASANGEVGLASKGGKVSDLLLHILQLHAADALGRLLLGDKDITLRCLAARFDVKDGVMKTDFLVLDTASSTITTKGTIDLGREELDLTVSPESKKIKLFSATSPIRITGRFKSPDVYPEPEAIAVRGGVGVALGLLNPIAALIALIDPGGADDQACGTFLEEVKKKAGVKESSLENPAAQKVESVKVKTKKLAGKK